MDRSYHATVSPHKWACLLAWKHLCLFVSKRGLLPPTEAVLYRDSKQSGTGRSGWIYRDLGQALPGTEVEFPGKRGWKSRSTT